MRGVAEEGGEGRIGVEERGTRFFSRWDEARRRGRRTVGVHKDGRPSIEASLIRGNAPFVHGCCGGMGTRAFGFYASFYVDGLFGLQP